MFTSCWASVENEILVNFSTSASGTSGISRSRGGVNESGCSMETFCQGVTVTVKLQWAPVGGGINRFSYCLDMQCKNSRLKIQNQETNGWLLMAYLQTGVLGRAWAAAWHANSALSSPYNTVCHISLLISTTTVPLLAKTLQQNLENLFGQTM